MTRFARKSLAILLIVIVTFLVMGGIAYSKDVELSDIYSEMQYTRIATEAQQYLRHLEEILPCVNDTLEVTLDEILLTSSYMQGINIFDKSGHVIASSGESAEPSLPLGVDNGGWWFQRQGDTSWITIFMQSGEEQGGKLVICLNSASIDRGNAQARQTALIQTVTIFVEIGLIGILFIIASKKTLKHPRTYVAVVITIVVVTSAFLDLGIELTRLNYTISGTAKQSAQQLSQVLESQRESAQAGMKGYDYMTDLSGYLHRVEREAVYIEAIYPATDGLLHADYSKAYVKNMLLRASTDILIPFVKNTKWDETPKISEQNFTQGEKTYVESGS